MLTPSKLEHYLSTHFKQATHWLCMSDCQPLSLLQFPQELLQKLTQQELMYSEPDGILELRKEIALLYDNVHTESIKVDNGGAEAIWITLHALLNKGDHVIVHYPSYPALYSIPGAIGCDVTHWHAEERHDWRLDLNVLFHQVKPHTKLIIINFPHNPTGNVMEHANFIELVKFARSRGIYILSDEVYRGLEYDESTRLPSIVDVYERGIAIGSCSKSFSAPGLRIGWRITSDKQLLVHMATLKAYTTICNTALGQHIAVAILQRKATLLAANKQLLIENLTKLDQFIQQYPQWFQWVAPMAGTTAFPRLMIKDSAERFCQRLLEETGVLLVPSSTLDYPDNYVRIGFGRQNFSQGLEKLADFMQHHY